MPTLVANCPRCGTKLTTFDCYADIRLSEEGGWLGTYEVFGICRACHQSSIYVVRHKSYETARIIPVAGPRRNSLAEYKGSLNDALATIRVVSVQDQNVVSPPEYLPEIIDKVMREANTCLSMQCANAAATMYRLALDLCTKPLVADGEANPAIRRSLGLRLRWLLDNDRIPRDLERLAQCIQQDGNDGAHDGTLTREDAEDIKDFTDALLARLYTEPRRLELAEERRAARRADRIS